MIDFTRYADSAHTVTRLFDSIVEILEAHPEGLTEYELIQELSHAGPTSPDGDDPGSVLGNEMRAGDLQLFRSHFFLFHVLYRLRDHLLARKRYVLSIFCLEIRLFPYREASGGIAEADPMREYYLDLRNMEDMDESEVRKMLEGFFARLESYSRMEEDLAALDLRPGAAPDTVKRRYRHLALRHHPDRGGDAQVFRKISEAMSRLSAAYGIGLSEGNAYG